MVVRRLARMHDRTICVVSDLHGFLPAVSYTLEVLFGNTLSWVTPWTDTHMYSDFTVAYTTVPIAEFPDRLLWIVPDAHFWQNYGRSDSLPQSALELVNGTPLLYGHPEVVRHKDTLTSWADIVASAYFLVTRYEETVRRTARDMHGRFPGRESVPYRKGFLHRPVVDEYSDILHRWCEECRCPMRKPSRQFSLLLTHDVDILRKCPRPLNAIKGILRGTRPVGALFASLAIEVGLLQDVYDTFDTLVELDGRVLATGLPGDCTYFWMAGGSTQYDGAYDIRSRLAKTTLDKLTESGANIGLHTSYEAGMRPILIQSEKHSLEEVCGTRITRNRHHYLAWREVEDGWSLVRAGITWDTTLGYADVAGFRLGVCHPIPLFDPLTLEPFGIEEHPLLVMDCTLSNKDYMNLDEEQAIDYCRGLLEQTRRHNGEFVALWHNTWNSEDAAYAASVYARLLDMVAK